MSVEKKVETKVNVTKRSLNQTSFSVNKEWRVYVVPGEQKL